MRWKYCKKKNSEQFFDGHLQIRKKKSDEVTRPFRIFEQIVEQKSNEEYYILD